MDVVDRTKRSKLASARLECVQIFKYSYGYMVFQNLRSITSNLLNQSSPVREIQSTSKDPVPEDHLNGYIVHIYHHINVQIFKMLDIDFYSDFDSTWDGEGGVGSSDPSKGEKQLVRHFYHSLQNHHCYMSEHTHISRRPYFLKF